MIDDAYCEGDTDGEGEEIAQQQLSVGVARDMYLKDVDRYEGMSCRCIVPIASYVPSSV